MMQSEAALTDYIFAGIVKDLDAWQNCDDIYGLWLHIGLFEDDSKRPYIISLVCLRTSVTDSPDALDYGSEWATPLGEEYTLGLCEDAWSSEYGSRPGDAYGNQLRQALFQQKLSEGGQSGDELLWFLDVCGNAIRRIHEENHLPPLYGKAIPIGIWISNDVPHDITMPITRDSNPARISQGMEEWLIGRTYAQIAAEQTLMVEVRGWSVEQQAHFWWQALRGQSLWISKLGTTAQWDQLIECGVYKIHWEPSTTALLADLVIAEAEARLSVEFSTPPEGKAAESSLMEFFALEHYSEMQAQVQEESITRLHRLLQKLYEDSKKRKRIGSAVQLTARALHALRPARFPAVRFTGDRENPNRLLEPERFGLK